MRVMNVRSRFTVFFAILVVCFMTLSGVASAQKVTRSVPSVVLSEGQSANVNLTLNAPIICAGSPPVCDVELTFVSSDPSQLSVPSTPIIWDAADWSQVRTLTITALDDGVYSADKSITVSTVAVSNAPYYSGFAVSIPVTVHNINPAPLPGIANRSITIGNSANATNIDVLGGVSGSPDVASLSITIAPTHGAATTNGPNITYTPATAYAGPDTLTYRVCSSLDATVCATAMLGITVNAAAKADPTATLADTGVNPHLTVILAVTLIGLAVISRFSASRITLKTKQ